MHKTLKLLFVVLAQTVAFTSFGQFAQKAPASEDGDIWILTNIPVEFPGGMSKFYKYVDQKLKCSARKADTKKVMVQFIIDSTGFVRKGYVKFVDSKYINNLTISGHISTECAEHLVELFENCPKWNPGYVEELEKAVPVRMATPVSFK